MKKSLKAIAASALSCGLLVPAHADSGGLPESHSVSSESTVEARNKALIVRLYFQFFNTHDISFAQKYISPTYIQHNPNIGTGRQSFVDLIQSLVLQFPQSQWNVDQMVAANDLVWVHVHQTNAPGDPGANIIDIYRIRDGIIVEHWDAGAAVSVTPANANTQF